MLKWLWSDNYSNKDSEAGPTTKGVPHPELFTNVGTYPLVLEHFNIGAAIGPQTYIKDFYKIPGGCHAVLTLNNPKASEWILNFSHWYMQSKLFLPIGEKQDGLWDTKGRYKNNSLVVGLELAWGKVDEEVITDWKYENIHFLSPSVDTISHFPYYDGELTPFAQQHGVYVPYVAMPYGYELQWAMLHVYNYGNTVYCSGIDFGVWSNS